MMASNPNRQRSLPYIKGKGQKKSKEKIIRWGIGHLLYMVWKLYSVIKCVNIYTVIIRWFHIKTQDRKQIFLFLVNKW